MNLANLFPHPIVINDDAEAIKVLQEAGLGDIVTVSPVPGFNQFTKQFEYAGYYWLATLHYGFTPESENGWQLLGLPQTFGRQAAQNLFDEILSESQVPGTPRVPFEIIK